MKVGDIVRVLMPSMGTKIKIGVITKQLPDTKIGLRCFEVMTGDGKIERFTSAALRPT